MKSRKNGQKFFKNKNAYFYLNICFNEFHVIFLVIKIIFWNEALSFLVRHR